MSTSSIHHRAKHRSRVRRLALPAAVVLGLTLAAQWSNSFDSALWSPAHAGGPSSAAKKVEPRVMDFNKLAKQKSEARQLLDVARTAAAKGDFEAARRHADKAATIPVEWNLGESSPKKFLEDLQSGQSNPQRLTEPITAVIKTPIMEHHQQSHRPHQALDIETPALAADRDMIGLVFPDDRPGVTKTADERLSSTDEPLALKIKQETPSHSANAEMTKTQRTPGFKTSNSAISTPETTTTAPRTKHRFAPIPSLAELAESAPVSDSPANQPTKTVIKAPIVELSQQPHRTLDIETPTLASDRNVIGRVFLDDRPGVTNTVDEVLASTDEPPTLKIKQETPSPSANVEMPKTQRTPGFKNSNSTIIAPETAATTLRTKQSFASILSLTELAESAPVSDSPANQPTKTVSKAPIVELPQQPHRQHRTLEVETPTPTADRNVIGRVFSDDRPGATKTADEGLSSAGEPPTLKTKQETPTPTTIINNNNEVHVAERPASVTQPVSVDQPANANSASASQFLLMAGLLGALLLLVAIAVLVLLKNGPNVQFALNVEVNRHNAVATSAPVTKTATRAKNGVRQRATSHAVATSVPVAKTATQVAPVTKITSIYAPKRQMKEAFEHEQEDPMMRQLFNDNLKLREQLEETQFAA